MEGELANCDDQIHQPEARTPSSQLKRKNRGEQKQPKVSQALIPKSWSRCRRGLPELVGGAGSEDMRESESDDEMMRVVARARRRVAGGATRNPSRPPPKWVASSSAAADLEPLPLPADLEPLPLPLPADLETLPLRTDLAQGQLRERRKKLVPLLSEADVEPLTNLKQQQVRERGNEWMIWAATVIDAARFKMWVAIFVMVMLVMPTIFLEEDYHGFADQRLLFPGIPNTLNVVSSILLSLVGLAGLIVFYCKSYFSLCSRRELLPWTLLFVGFTVVGFGTSYHHLNPKYKCCHTFPMIIAFASTVSIFIAEWFDEWVGKRSLAPPFTQSSYWLWATGFYILAAVGGVADKAIYRWTLQILSGHTLEHLCATVATALSTLALVKRSITIEPERHRTPVYHQLALAFTACLFVPRMICIWVLDIVTEVLATMYEIIIFLWEFGAHLVAQFVFLVMTSLKQAVSKTPHHTRLMMTPHPGIWGMELYKSKVHKFLESKLSHDAILGLWGTSGVGKTRLLKVISGCYGNADSPFHRIFVLQDGNVRDMQHDLAVLLNLNWNAMSSSQEHCRAYIISEHLKHNSFLLLLDDVQDGHLDLASIGLPMPLGSSQKVILTSRSQAVCGRMGCTEANTVEMKCLGDEDAWNLFKYRAGVEITEANGEVFKIAKMMVSACGGLPRAICSIGIGIAAATCCGTNPDDWWYAYERFKAKNLPPDRMEEFVAVWFRHRRMGLGATAHSPGR